MRRIVLFVIVLGIACRETAQRELVAGEHRVRVAIPSGWQELNQGRQVVIRKEELDVVLSDMGAVHAEGFRKEVERARDLWRAGREAEARTRLREVPLRDELLPNRGFFEAWQRVEGFPFGTPFAAVEVPFNEFLRVIDSMEPASLDVVVDDALPRLDHDERRYTVRTRETKRVDGREAMAVETSLQQTTRRYLIIVNGGRVLAVRCDRCSDPSAAKAFDQVANSLQFSDESRK